MNALSKFSGRQDVCEFVFLFLLAVCVQPKYHNSAQQFCFMWCEHILQEEPCMSCSGITSCGAVRRYFVREIEDGDEGPGIHDAKVVRITQ